MKNVSQLNEFMLNQKYLPYGGRKINLIQRENFSFGRYIFWF